MNSSDDIAAALRPIVPANMQAAILALSRLLASVASGALAPEEAQAQITTAQLKQLIVELAGQQINTSSATLSFGQGNQLGDVSVRDVIRGNSVNLTVIMSISPAYQG